MHCAKSCEIIVCGFGYCVCTILISRSDSQLLTTDQLLHRSICLRIVFVHSSAHINLGQNANSFGISIQCVYVFVIVSFKYCVYLISTPHFCRISHRFLHQWQKYATNNFISWFGILKQLEFYFHSWRFDNLWKKEKKTVDNLHAPRIRMFFFELRNSPISQGASDTISEVSQIHAWKIPVNFAFRAADTKNWPKLWIDQKTKFFLVKLCGIKSRELKQNRELKRNLVDSDKITHTHKADAKWIGHEKICWWLLQQRTKRRSNQIIRIVVDNDGHCAVSHKKFSVRPVQGIECRVRVVLERASQRVFCVSLNVERSNCVLSV